jgi:hypothetical protein
VSGSISERVAGLCALAADVTAGTALADEVTTITERFTGPPRVAIAGRIKAGKSTLLNALVGERLAPTDAGECTRIVTAYGEASTYQVRALLHDGAKQALTFDRRGGKLDIDLGDLDPAAVARIDVGWPSTALRDRTLIDTPGLASLDDQTSQRTRRFFEHNGGGGGQADVVVYLLRHVHRDDVELLTAFADAAAHDASPVTAVAVLSRADELGGGRPDALAAATRVAARYQADPRIRRLCAAVVPVAGLLAETGQTLTQDEYADLRVLADLPRDLLGDLLLSADLLCDLPVEQLAPDRRRHLVDRLGMFGLRFAAGELAHGRHGDSQQLAAALIELSGLPRLTAVLDAHLGPRVAVLKARSALASLTALGRALAQADPSASARLDAATEEVAANAVELDELRLAQLLQTDVLALELDAVDELLELLAGRGPRENGELVEAINRWRARAADPFADLETSLACETAARLCESRRT